MVQLKPFANFEFAPLFTYFNSIMVQLKHNERERNPHDNTFQFHNGTIKTDYSFILPAILPKFQFHNGTIKTLHELPHLHFPLHFNSIMVQLKLIDIYNGNLVFTEVSLRINIYFFAVKMSMYNESIFVDLRQHLHLIFIVKG